MRTRSWDDLSRDEWDQTNWEKHDDISRIIAVACLQRIASALEEIVKAFGITPKNIQAHTDDDEARRIDHIHNLCKRLPRPMDMRSMSRSRLAYILLRRTNLGLGSTEMDLLNTPASAFLFGPVASEQWDTYRAKQLAKRITEKGATDAAS